MPANTHPEDVSREGPAGLVCKYEQYLHWLPQAQFGCGLKEAAVNLGICPTSECPPLAAPPKSPAQLQAVTGCARDDIKFGSVICGMLQTHLAFCL